MNYGVKITAIFLLISLAIFSHAGYLDDWTDDQICGWMENPTPPEYIVEEAVKRNLNCEPELATKKAQEDTGLQIMIYDISLLKDEITSDMISCEDGNIAIEKDCFYTGLITSYYQTNKVKSEQRYKNGKLEGKWNTWYENGQIKIDMAYKDGKRKGQYLAWHENGQKKIETMYHDDKLNGQYHEWNKIGHLKLSANYIDGKLDGEKTIWYESGKIKSKAKYITGNLDGEKMIWDESGLLLNDENSLLMSIFDFNTMLEEKTP